MSERPPSDAGRAAHNAIVGVVEFYGALLEQGEREKVLLVMQLTQAREQAASLGKAVCVQEDATMVARGMLKKVLDAEDSVARKMVVSAARDYLAEHEDK